MFKLTIDYVNGNGPEHKEFEGDMSQLYSIMAQYRNLKGTWEVKPLPPPPPVIPEDVLNCMMMDTEDRHQGGF